MTTSEKGGSKAGKGGGRNPAFTPARIAVLTLAVLGLIFIFQNTQETEIRLLIPLVTMPLWTALLGTAVIGALCGAYAASRRRRK
ncbi:lipopolysaccharide assembly protein LapA domain-containing protein [Streptomyces sp. YS415]|uniref:lipopolysaccharide assembly protein LapA domain-containing protein n=1 Tax=Streptomyces sp. YS415 TaxID=2944806 RepID=UPI002021F180|nr:LapA family protein [Streptomyces sp. YS415]MCL7428332.1 LapA family protein [Streptomyces sp. YS415]